MNTISCLVVDDESLARRIMRRLLSAHTDFQIVGEAEDIVEAARLVRELHPEVIFLDIQMPGGDGFQLLQDLMPEPPHIVFVTAFDRYAMRAFEINALDYLLKPVRPERLAASLQRLRQRLSLENGVPEPVPATLPKLNQDDRVFLKAGQSGCFVQVEDIMHITARGNRSAVFLRNGNRIFVRQSMSSWVSQLPPDGFAQLDRSCIVQWRQIQHMSLNSTGGLIQFGTPGSELSLGRPAATRLKQLLAQKPG